MSQQSSNTQVHRLVPLLGLAQAPTSASGLACSKTSTKVDCSTTFSSLRGARQVSKERPYQGINSQGRTYKGRFARTNS